MKLKFLGSGSAFTMNNYQTNAVLEADTGKRMLIDCGSDIRFSMRDAGLSHKDIQALYLTHCQENVANALSR